MSKIKSQLEVALDRADKILGRSKKSLRSMTYNGLHAMAVRNFLTLEGCCLFDDDRCEECTVAWNLLRYAGRKLAPKMGATRLQFHQIPMPLIYTHPDNSGFTLVFEVGKKYPTITFNRNAFAKTFKKS